MNTFQSDCDGANSFSGTGYFDELGELKVNHQGDDIFLDEEDFSNTPKLNAIKEAFDKCISADILDDNEMNRYYTETSKTIDIHEKNPRTTVLNATLFFDLISNKAKGTMIVYQGNNVTNINGTIHIINTFNQTDNE